MRKPNGKLICSRDSTIVSFVFRGRGVVWTRHKDEGGGKNGQNKRRGVIGEEQIRQSMCLRRQRCRGKNFKFVAHRRGSIDGAGYRRLIDRLPKRSRIDGRGKGKMSWDCWTMLEIVDSFR